MLTRTIVATAAVSLVLGLSAASHAQSSSKPKASGATQDADAASTVANVDLLAGPKVEEEAENGRNNPMVAPNNANRQRGGNNDGLPFRQWMEVVRGVGLTPEQQKAVQMIAAEMQSAQRSFQREHGEELRKLQQEARTARQSGKTPPENLREKLQQLEADSPKAVDFQQRIWNELTDAQQSAMRAELAEAEVRRQEQRRAGSDRNGPQKDQPETMDAMIGKDAAMQPMTDAPGAEATPAAPARERARQRRANGNPGIADRAGLDEQARRRMQFLMEHQDASRAGSAPTEREKTFRFDEKDAS